jgi:hypothetical protein
MAFCEAARPLIACCFHPTHGSWEFPWLTHQASHSQVIGPLVELMPESCWGCATRAVPMARRQILPPSCWAAGPASTPAGSAATGSVAKWGERFLISLPPLLAEALSSPGGYEGAEEDRAVWAGVPLTLRFLIQDHSRPDAPTLAAASAAVTYDWLANQVVRLSACAPAECCWYGCWGDCWITDDV